MFCIEQERVQWLNDVVVEECPTKQLCFFPHLLHVTSGRVSSCSQTPEDGAAPWAVLAEQPIQTRWSIPAASLQAVLLVVVLNTG